MKHYISNSVYVMGSYLFVAERPKIVRNIVSGNNHVYFWGTKMEIKLK